MVTESAAVSFVGGACSGLVCTVLFQPLDFIKTQLQANRSSSKVQHLFSSRAQLYRGLVERAWWIGLRPSLAKTIPGVACYFVTLSQIKKMCGTNLGPVSVVVMGALSRTITVVVVQPLTLIKTRYESGRFGYKSIHGAVQAIVAEEKLHGLYRGLGATIVRDAPFSGIYLAFYSHLKLHTFAGSDSVASTTLSGLVAGSLASLITHPADVIKTRIQIDNTTQRGSLRHIVPKIYQEGGVSGFYSGFAPRLVRRTLVSATAWLVYEEVKKKSHLFQSRTTAY
ncbi:hypothetical protein ACHWQZ_G013598 [Mnemiopsis leidyi]